MYISILCVHKNFHGFSLLMTKTEFKIIMNRFDWVVNTEGYLAYKQDNIDKEGIQVLKEYLYPELEKDFEIKNLELQFDDTIYFFTRKNIYEKYFSPLHKGPAPMGYGDQMTPLTRPKFIYGDDVQEWYPEYGVYRSVNLRTKATSFIHPKSYFHLFFKEKEYPDYLIKREKEMKASKKSIQDETLFIRLINVYSKEDSNLMYRIVFDEFYSMGINLRLKPHKNDEVYFFKSYKINKNLANYIFKNSNNYRIDFNFDKYEYYIEVLRADSFIYSYQEFKKDLEN